MQQHTLSIAFLLIRLVGFGMAVHGAQKLFGWFGGHGLAGTGGFFEKLGFRPGRLFAFAAGMGEFAGGVLTGLGLGGALGPALIVVTMVVAALSVHVRNGFLQSSNGFELNSVYIAVAVALGYTGPGELSLDRALHLNVLTSITNVTIAFVIAVVLGLLIVAARRPPPAPETPV